MGEEDREEVNIRNVAAGEGSGVKSREEGLRQPRKDDFGVVV
jgi:hypothetical protein